MTGGRKTVFNSFPIPYYYDCNKFKIYREENGIVFPLRGIASVFHRQKVRSKNLEDHL